MSDTVRVPSEIDELVAKLETSIDGVVDSFVNLKESARANAVKAVDSVDVLAHSVEDIRESISTPLPALRSAAGT